MPRWLVLIGIVVLSCGSVQALGEGPSLPEAMQFEPVDATDAVNLTTGDFTYVLPVLSLPGPGGDFPLSMSYHARIGPNQEATWVGLGWSLNPGSVNRTVNGYPDDYRADFVKAHYESPGISGSSVGFGISFGYAYGSVGLNMNYDCFTGNLGVNAMASFHNLSVSINSAGGATAGAGVGFGPLGASGSFSVTAHGVRASTGAGINLPLNSHIGFTLSSSAGPQANFQVLGFGPQSMSTAGPGRSWSTTHGFSLPILPFLAINLAASEWGWYLDQTYIDLSYGYLHQSAYMNDPANRHEVFDTLYKKKFERMENNTTLFPAQDVYVVAAQGMSGVFKPFARKMVHLKDGLVSEYKAQLLSIPQVGTNTPGDISFRFLGDTGANFTTTSIPHPSGLAYQPGNIFQDRTGSRLIEPRFDPISNKLVGFHITDGQGTTYEFDQPVMTWVEQTWSQEKTSLTVGGTTVDSMLKSTRLLGAPYATNWLLTAIKGPDFVDRNGNSVSDTGDWGYWVTFRYHRSPRPQIWRSPHQGMGPGPGSKNIEMASAGLRDMVHLVSVETSSHVALFRTSDRLDRRTPVVTEELALPGKYVSRDTTRLPDLVTYVYKFPGDWRHLHDTVSDQTEFLELTYSVRDPASELISFGHKLRLSKELSRRTTALHAKSPAAPAYDWSVGYDGYNTVITINLRSTSFALSIYEAHLLTQAFFPQSFADARRLDRIELFAKSDPGLRFDGRWSTTNQAESLKSVVFEYDHSLVPGTPNSQAGGKLTLKSATFLGRGGQDSGLPPYRFEYAGGAISGSGLNPSYHEDDWDNWGSYRSPAGGRGRRIHHTPQTQAEADFAAAWSLTGIITPTGAKIAVDYESDDYYFVSDHIDDVKFGIRNDSGPTPETNAYEVTPEAPDVVSVTNDRGLHPNNARNFPNRIVASQVGFAPERYVAIVESPRTSMVYPSPEKSYVRRLTGVSYFNRPSIGIGPPQFAGLRLTFDGNPISFDTTSKRYFVKLYPRRVLGGGVRVKRLTISDSERVYRTLYRYQTENGFSSGVTASLPSLYEDVRLRYGVIDSLKPSVYAQSSPNHSAPTVIYSRVEVVDVDEKDQSINGKTVYEFATARTYPLERRTLQSSSSGRNEDRMGTDSVVAIFDRSGIYGFPTAVTDYELRPGGVQLAVRKRETLYAFSDELEKYAQVLRPDDSLVVNAPIGVTHERYRYENDWGRTSEDHGGKILFTNGDVSKYYVNPYRIGADVSLYYPDRPAQSLITRTRNFQFDGLSGVAIGDAVERSDGLASIRKRILGYWRYPALKAKNMLTQLAQDTSYTASLSVANTDILRRYAFPPDDIVESTVTTWKNWGDNVWRANDSYEYDKQHDRASLGPYSPFTAWSYDGHAFPRVTADNPWRMLSNNTAYNAASQVTEQVASDGRYSAVLYDESGALQVAIIANARLQDTHYFDFEQVNGLQTAGTVNTFFSAPGRTGTRAFRAFAAAAPYYRLGQFRAQQPYTVSLWARKGSADRAQRVRLTFLGPATGGVALPQYASLRTNNDWDYLELTFIPVQTGTAQIAIDLDNLPNTGGQYHLIDDLRIHPKQAAMKVFTYDPRTLAVTAVTDENNVSNFFEYDGWGRLVLTRDQDNHIRTRHRYHYLGK